VAGRARATPIASSPPKLCIRTRPSQPSVRVALLAASTAITEGDRPVQLAVRNGPFWPSAAVSRSERGLTLAVASIRKQLPDRPGFTGRDSVAACQGVKPSALLISTSVWTDNTPWQAGATGVR
jgi:hypothetical protein